MIKLMGVNQNHYQNHLHNGKNGGMVHFNLCEEGDLDLPLLFKTLHDCAYCGFVSLDVLGRKAIEDSWNYLSNKYLR